MTLSSPAIAGDAAPGQFVHLAVGAGMLRRPFSVYRADGGRFELLYRIKGEGTRRMAAWRPGGMVDLLGPLGTGFAAKRPGERILLVGGGVGVAPLAFFGDRHHGGGVAVLGFGSRDQVCGADRLEAAGYDVVLTTQDGTAGRTGTVLDGLASLGYRHHDRILACGPWPMLAAVAAWAGAAEVPCEVAVEREMGCGIGACLGCVVETGRTDRPYARACTEGPVLDAREVRWTR